MNKRKDSNQVKRPRLEDVCDSESQEELCDVLDSDDELHLNDSGSEEEEDELLISTTSFSSEHQIPGWSTTGELRDIKFAKCHQQFHPIVTPNPIDYFLYFVDEDFLSMVCQETNLYAERVLCSEGVTPQSRITSWNELTVTELKIFFGLLLLMGIIQLSKLQDYWKTSRLFQIQVFSEYMSRNRFLLIFKCLNFSSETNKSDPFFKIKKITEYFNKKMSECYYPSRELLLDESMVFCKGQLKFPQFIASKSHKYRIKLYMLTDLNDIVLNYCVHKSISNKKHMENVVMKLMEDKLLKGHSLYMSSYYNSCSLAKRLLENNTYCTGILQKHLNENPKEVVNKNLNKGENISRFCCNIHVGKWKDKSSVMYITTEYENRMGNIANTADPQFIKPEALIQYNKYMSGVDLEDQIMAFYPCERVPLQWHKKIFIHTLQLLLINSHKIYNKFSGAQKLSLYDYYLAIINTLLPVKPSVNMKTKSNTKSHRSSMHVISKILNKSSNGRVKRKVCQVCSKAGKRKDTIYHCLQCTKQPGLCLECFDIFHTQHFID